MKETSTNPQFSITFSLVYYYFEDLVVFPLLITPEHRLLSFSSFSAHLECLSHLALPTLLASPLLHWLDFALRVYLHRYMKHPPSLTPFMLT